MKVKQWLRRRWRELQIFDPNSPEGLRERARRLIEKGVATDSPYVSVLVKQALMKEKRSDEVPNPNSWELMSAEEKEEWVLMHLELKLPK